MKLLPLNYKSVFKTEVSKAPQIQTSPGIVTEQDIKHLPEPVQKYLRYVGFFGKEKSHSVRIEFTGEFKTECRVMCK